MPWVSGVKSKSKFWGNKCKILIFEFIKMHLIENFEISSILKISTDEIKKKIEPHQRSRSLWQRSLELAVGGFIFK